MYKKRIIKKFLKEDIQIILCTGRPRYKGIEISKELGINNYVISSNGAEIYDYINDKIIFINEINKSLCKNLFNTALENNARILLSTDNKEYTNREIRNENQVIIEDSIEVLLNKYKIKQCQISGDNLEIISKLRDEIKSNNNDLRIINESSCFNTKEKKHYDEIWFSIVNNTTSKGNAIKFIAEYLNVPLENTIGIGNDYNDISMFEVVGKSIAMGNACNEIKQMADIITESNNKDGVAIILKKLYKELKKYLNYKIFFIIITI